MRLTLKKDCQILAFESLKKLKISLGKTSNTAASVRKILRLKPKIQNAEPWVPRQLNVNEAINHALRNAYRSFKNHRIA